MYTHVYIYTCVHICIYMGSGSYHTFRSMLRNICKVSYLGSVSYCDTLKNLIKHTTKEDFDNFEKYEGLISGRKWLCTQFEKNKYFCFNYCINVKL